MKPKEVVNKLIDKSDFKKADIARVLGISPQALDVRLSKGENPQLKTLIDILGVIGYQVVVTRKGAKLPPDAIILESPEKSKELVVEKKAGRKNGKNTVSKSS